jgi:hypothetical protein
LSAGAAYRDWLGLNLTYAPNYARFVPYHGLVRAGLTSDWWCLLRADYLDLEPRLNLGEIEPRPERLDRQLLEVMLSHHPSGLAVVAAPKRA